MMVRRPPNPLGCAVAADGALLGTTTGRLVSRILNDPESGHPHAEHTAIRRSAGGPRGLAGLAAWWEDVPFSNPQARRNALTLQALLGIVLAVTALLAVVAFFSSDVGITENRWGIYLIAAGAAGCLVLLRGGRFRLAAGLTVLGGLMVIGMSYQAYGLRAQSGLQFAQLLPLLLAGLLLGRVAMWTTAIANAAALLIGARVDMGLAGNPAASSEVLPALLLAGMNLLVLVAVLDRLLLSTHRALRRSEELDAACRALEREVSEKEQAYARLVQTQRMEAIGRLSTGIAHDFHNILSIILGLATSPLSPSEPPAPVLARIAKAARRGTAITRRLLNFGRVQSNELATFDLVEAIEEMWPLLEPMFPRGIKVSLRLPPPGIPVRMDREELELMLMNVASNACDAMPGGGTFTLRLEGEPEHARVELEDTGIGMAPEVAEKLFEPFFTTKPRDKGTGIGMAIVHRFVRNCGGDIAVRSAPGAGTCIVIRIPVATEAAPA